MMPLKCCTQYASKYGKLSSGHRTGNGQFSFQSPRRAMPKNVETIIQLHSFHMLSRLFSKSFKLALAVCEPRTSGVQAGLRKDRGTRGQIANIHWVIEEAREFQKNINCCFIDYPRAFYCVDHSELWKILEKMGVAHHLTCLLRNLYVGQEATVRTGTVTMDLFKIGKGI